MKCCLPVLLACIVLLKLTAAETSISSAASELPKEVDAQEQVVLLSAKVKSLAEVQDVILKQQQLIFQHLEELRKQVASLQAEQSNALTRADLSACLDKVEELRKRMDAEHEAAALAPPAVKTNLLRGSAFTNAVGSSRFQGYRVQPGDTLSKVLVRINDTFESQGLQRVTQEQVEHANPGMNTERIRVGQMILIPIPDPKPSAP